MTSDSPNPATARVSSVSNDPELEAARRFGLQSQTERSVRRIVPWVVSFAVHLMLVILGFVVTWTVIHLQDDEAPVEIVADFDAITYDPVVRMAESPAEVVKDATQDRVPVADPAEALDTPSDRPSPLELLSTASRSEALARLAPTPSRATATFVGLTSTNAQRIVYVIDASGSMMRSRSFLLDELERSVAGLVPEQSFAVVFFQDDRAVVVPPRGRLHPATESEKRRVHDWIDREVRPEGGSNPLQALAYALRLKPDAIFLLSENITGSGRFEIDKQRLLDQLERLNPAGADGRRPVQINCVQFLDEDPLDTLREIARLHGGKNGYKFLTRAELGLRRP